MLPALPLPLSWCLALALAGGSPAGGTGAGTGRATEPAPPQEASVGLVETVWTEARGPVSLATGPASRTWRLDARELDEGGDLALQQALSRLPGQAPPTEDPDTVPSPRGLGGPRAIFLLDGTPVTTERRAGVSGGLYRPETLGAVEFLRGPEALLYGTAVGGGVLLVESPWGSPGEGQRGRAGAEIRTGDGPAYAGRVAWREDGWSVAVAERSLQDAETPTGARVEQEARARSAFLGRTWLAGSTLWRAGVRADRLAGADRPALRGNGHLVRLPHEAALRATVRGTRDLGAGEELDVIGWWGSDERELARQETFGPADVPGSLVARTRAYEAGGRAIRTWRGDGWTLRGSVEAMRRQGVRTRLAGGAPGVVELDAVPLADGEESSLATAVAGDLRLGEHWRLAGGLRAGYRGSRAMVPSGSVHRSETPWAAGAALVREGRRGRWFVSLHRSERLPTLTERFYEGVTGKGWMLPSPSLDPERGWGAELSWDGRVGPADVALTWFCERLDDVIVRDFGAPGVPPAPWNEMDVYRFVNAGKGRLSGFEAWAQAVLGSGWSVHAAAHRVLGEDGTGDPLSAIPPDAIALGVVHRWPGGGFVRLDAWMVGRKDDPGHGEVEVPGYTRLDLAGAVPLLRGVVLRLALRNVTDREFVPSPRKRTPPAPGRTLVAALDATW